jgi:hypothetical protein
MDWFGTKYLIHVRMVSPESFLIMEILVVVQIEMQGVHVILQIVI